MIDFHAHILPGLDDGIQTMDDAIKVLKEAKKAGFEKIICTTHYSNYYTENEETRKNKLKELQEKERAIELIIGNEVYARTDIDKVFGIGEASTLNNSKYVLYEMPIHKEYPKYQNLVIDLISAGYKPVLAHPERYVIIQENPKKIEELLELGVYLQSNFMSIEGLYGSKCKKTVELLLKHNMISFLGTDVHSTKAFYPHIKDASKKIIKIIGENNFNEITNINPEKVCRNEEVDFPEWNPIEKGFLGSYK